MLGFILKSKVKKALCLSFVLASAALFAEENQDLKALDKHDPNVTAQANNPLAKIKSIVIQDNYIGKLTMSGDREANQTWLRYAQPFTVEDSLWLMRASLPIMSYPTGSRGDMETGVGDFNIFAAYLIDTGNPKISFGIGPMLTMPTGSDAGLGSDQWEAGFSSIFYNCESKIVQYGSLLTWQHSFAGDRDREEVNIGAFQYFIMVQLGKGLYLRSTPIMSYNFENDAYSVPVGLGIGKIFKIDEAVYNIYVEPQYSVADDGAFQPDWQIFMGFNIQFQ